MAALDTGSKNRMPRSRGKMRRVWAVPYLALQKFSRIDGAQSAAAFAHYAFFSLFPFIVLIVTVASIFIDRDRAGKEVVSYVK